MAHAPRRDELGWPWPLSNMSSFVEPFDTYADMSHLLDREAWPRASGRGASRTSAMRCTRARDPAAAPDPAYRRRRRGDGEGQRHRVPSPLGSASLARVVDPPPASFAGSSWPGAAPPATRRASTRSSGAPTSTRPTTTCCRFPAQAAIASSPARRASTTWSSPGDWTDCGLNAGCVEAAVMSGRLAAHALTGAAAARGDRRLPASLTAPARLNEYGVGVDAPGGCSG